MYYIYFLYSDQSDKYYIGYTEQPEARLYEHNYSDKNSFTSKHRPWKIVALFECGDERSIAMKIEKFIKKQKSRRLIEDIIRSKELYGILIQLVRVPHLLD